MEKPPKHCQYLGIFGECTHPNPNGITGSVRNTDIKNYELFCGTPNDPLQQIPCTGYESPQILPASTSPSSPRIE